MDHRGTILRMSLICGNLVDIHWIERHDLLENRMDLIRALASLFRRFHMPHRAFIARLAMRILRNLILWMCHCFTSLQALRLVSEIMCICESEIAIEVEVAILVRIVCPI